MYLVLSLALSATVGAWTREPRAAGDSTLSAFARAKAESLLKDRMPCLGCHRLGNDGGRIGPDLSDVASRRSGAYIAQMVNDPQRTVPGTMMPRTPMPESMRTLVVRYLQGSGGAGASGGGSAGAAAAAGSPPAAKSATQSPASPNQIPAATTTSPQPAELRGDALYARYCVACHGASGNGDGPNAANLPVKPAVHASKDAMSRRPDDTLFDAIAGGGAVVGKSARMPAFGETLSHAQIRALVRHIRTLCRCEGPSWSTRAGR